MSAFAASSRRSSFRIRWSSISAYDDPTRDAGEPPYLDQGSVVSWHYGLSVDLLRVVRDDERGLVAWLPRFAPWAQRLRVLLHLRERLQDIYDELMSS